MKAALNIEVVIDEKPEVKNGFIISLQAYSDASVHRIGRDERDHPGRLQIPRLRIRSHPHGRGQDDLDVAHHLAVACPKPGDQTDPVGPAEVPLDGFGVRAPDIYFGLFPAGKKNARRMPPGAIRLNDRLRRSVSDLFLPIEDFPFRRSAGIVRPVSKGLIIVESHLHLKEHRACNPCTINFYVILAM